VTQNKLPEMYCDESDQSYNVVVVLPDPFRGIGAWRNSYNVANLNENSNERIAR